MVILWLPTRFRGVLAPWFGFSEGAKAQNGYSLAPHSVPGSPDAGFRALGESKKVILWLPARFRGVLAPGSGLSEGAKAQNGSSLVSHSVSGGPGAGFQAEAGPRADPPPTPPSSMLHCVKVASHLI